MVARLLEIETDPGADPLLGPVDHLPQHAPGGLKLEDLHVESADLAAVGAEAELDRSADLAFPLRVVRPPGGKTFTRGQCLVDFVRGRFDSNSMQNIHCRSPYWLVELMERLQVTSR